MEMLNGAPAPTLYDPTPSPEDVRITTEAVKAGALLDVEVLDHVIVGGARDRYVSLKERGLGFG